MTDCGPDLFRLAQQGDREAAEKLIEQNQGLVWSIVRRYLGRGVGAGPDQGHPGL